MSLIQSQILNKILETKDFSTVTLNNLTEDYFFDYKSEFNFIKNHYETYHTIPDKETVLYNFPEFDSLEVHEPDSYLISQLYKEYNQAYLASQFNTVRSLLEQDRSDDAVQCYLKAYEKLKQGSAINCTDLISDTSRFDRYLERTTDKTGYYISTGLPELDKLIGGIDRENENMVIAARTGIGKSWFIIFLAAMAVKQGLNIGFFSGEMSKDKVGYRLDTILGHVNNRDITRGNIYSQAAYQDYIKNISQKAKGSFKVITPNDIAGDPTVPALRAFVEREHIQVLFIDQYSLLEDTSHAKASFERVANISKAIKRLQVEKQIPIISVSQMNRTKNDDGTKDTTQIGLSDRIGQDATVVLMLDKKLDDTNPNYFILELSVTKSRDGGDNRVLKYRVDFNNGIFEYIAEDLSPEEADELRDSYEVEDGEGVF